MVFPGILWLFILYLFNTTKSIYLHYQHFIPFVIVEVKFWVILISLFGSSSKYVNESMFMIMTSCLKKEKSPIILQKKLVVSICHIRVWKIAYILNRY